MEKVRIQDFLIGKGEPLTIITGPCVIETEEETLASAKKLKQICDKNDVNFIFKSSYDKANRSSLDSYRGPGIEQGLNILQKVQKQVGVAVVTDVHTPEEAMWAGEVCDLIQIPAMLCRQTDLIVAAAKTLKPIQVKKGQFMAPWDMENVVKKITMQGNRKIILVERGASFGYNNLVSDMRSIPIMQEFGFPVCFDATHSVQLPGGRGTSSGGQKEYILPLTKAALAAGANALFMETHPKPDQAKSDSSSMLDFVTFERELPKLVSLYSFVQKEWR